MKVFRTGAAVIAALGFVGLVATSGCSGDSGKPQSIASEERVQEIVEMRKIYDKSGGNWDALSAEDKAAYIKLAGDEQKAKTMWTTMSTPMGSEPNTAAAPNIPMGGAQPAPATGG